MSYAKFDDKAPDHPKIAALSDRDHRAWFDSVCYCSRNLTDGFVPANIVRKNWRRSEDRLLAAGIWEMAEGGIRVHDYLDWNDSKEVVQRRKERAAKGGVARAQSVAASKAVSLSPSGAPSSAIALPYNYDYSYPSSSLTEGSPDMPPKVDPAGGGQGEPEANGRAWWLDDRWRATHEQRHFLNKLAELGGWEDLTGKGLQRLRSEFGEAVVTTALGHAWEEKLRPRRPYPWLSAACRSIQTQVRSA